jgi:hypothetical protein
MVIESLIRTPVQEPKSTTKKMKERGAKIRLQMLSEHRDPILAPIYILNYR